MAHPRDRHLESQNRANANIYAIAHTDTKIASTQLFDYNLSKRDSKTNLQNVTLDTLHQSHIAKLNEEREKANHLETGLVVLQKEYNILNDREMSSLTTEELQRLFTLECEIDKMKSKISEAKTDNHMAEYFMETGDILFEYYDNMKSISKGDDERRKRSLSSYQSNATCSTSSNGKTVIDFFRPQKTDDAQRKEHESSEKEENNKTPYLSRQVLLKKYLEKTNPSEVNSNQIYEAGELSDIDMCPDCNTERVLLQQEAILICPNPKCTRADNVLIDSNIPSYKESARENTSYYSYKRINHFNEWLAQFQAKETTDIPDDVYNRIYMELKKERISNMAKVTPSKMKEILKRLKLNKYYEHIPHITNRLNGQPAPVITRATEEKLRSMFKEIQGPFMKHCPSERKNFLSYSYVLHKFCQLLELDDFLQCFQLLKSREKLHVQDTIWEKICGELNWEFIKSV